MKNEIVKSELGELAKQINEAHDQCNSAFKYTLNYAIHAGDCLNKAKAKVGHGNWLPWLENNTDVPQPTAWRYMELSKHKNWIIANYSSLNNLTMDGALKLLKGGTPMLQSMSNEWYTPSEYLDAVREVMGNIDLDPASCYEANKTVGALRYYTEEDDGLSQPWYGRVFLNPPYGKLTSEFATKLYEEFDSTVSEAIMLVNSRATDADWFQPCFEGVICFTDHRIDFDAPSEKVSSSTHGSCFVYFGPNERRFAEVFSRFGNVVRRWGQVEI